MFENDGFMYYPTLAYFCIGLPFAVFTTMASCYYFIKWLSDRETQLLKAAAFCFVDGTLSLAFALVGIWLVLQEYSNNWIILFGGFVVSIPHILIARKVRRKIFQVEPSMDQGRHRQKIP